MHLSISRKITQNNSGGWNGLYTPANHFGVNWKFHDYFYHTFRTFGLRSYIYQTTQTDSNFIVQNEFSYLWSRGVYFGDTWWTTKVVQRYWVYGEAIVEITECINYAQSENCKSKNLYTFSLILMKSNWKHPKIVSKSGPKSVHFAMPASFFN